MSETAGSRGRPRWRTWLLRAVAGVAVVAVLAAAAAGGWLWWKHGEFDRAMSAAREAGFTDADVDVDGATVHVLRGPENGKPPLLLIHGQSTDAKSYHPVLADLAEHFEVYAVDCFGHGSSEHDPSLYNAVAHADRLAQFVREEIGEPVYVSGHSSGGILAARLAGSQPDLVRGALLEDPPFFTTQLPRTETTWNYVDLASTAHAFLDSTETDWPAFHWRHQRMWTFFGDSAQPIIAEGLRHRAEHPTEPIEVWYLPQFNETNRAIPDYDPRFGEAFHSGTWDVGLDLEATLAAIEAPAILVHTRVAYDEDGILMAAMGDEEAARARDLIPDVEFVKVDTGHGFHLEDPQHFVDLTVSLLGREGGAGAAVN